MKRKLQSQIQVSRKAGLNSDFDLWLDLRLIYEITGILIHVFAKWDCDRLHWPFWKSDGSVGGHLEAAAVCLLPNKACNPSFVSKLNVDASKEMGRGEME